MWESVRLNMSVMLTTGMWNQRGVCRRSRTASGLLAVSMTHAVGLGQFQE